MQAVSEARRLFVGDLAPRLSGRAAGGDTFDLAQWRGRPIWVAFFRYTSCVFCSMRIHEMVAKAPMWQRDGLEIVGVFQSPPEKVDTFVRERGISFPMLGDPNEALYARWGLETSLAGIAAPRLFVPMAKSVVTGDVFKKDGSLFRLPAEFLIDGDGRIAESHYGKDIGHHLPFAKVDKFVRERAG